MMHACPSTSVAYTQAISATASGVQVEGRTNPWLAIRAASMYFYIDAMWARAEDPHNRTLADLQMVDQHQRIQVSTLIACVIYVQ